MSNDVRPGAPAEEGTGALKAIHVAAAAAAGAVTVTAEPKLGEARADAPAEEGTGAPGRSTPPRPGARVSLLHI